MTQTEPQKQSPFKLNGARITILIFGVLVLVYVVSAMLGGLANYQALREAADASKAEAPATTAPAPPPAKP
jgi:hypothetical protein